MTLSAGTPIGKYVVRRKLAEGGMAEIYLCSVRGPEGFDKEVVIKRIRPFVGGDPEFIKMFMAEARVASRLNHPNVVQVFDFDKHEDAHYLAMEYVRGLSLWDARKLSKELMVPMPTTLVAHIGSEVARGLHYAHELREKGRLVGLVHRDVTPHNVLLSYDGAVKLTDFGIAKAGNRLTSPGMLKGKFAYMSPEQARGEDVDRRSDLFELGIVLWEMCTGGKLFDGDSDVAVLRAVQQRVIPPPVRLNPDVPAELDAIVMKALERDREARHQTAQEMEKALAQFVFAHRQKLEDTDVGAFLKRLVGEEATASLRDDPTPDAQDLVREPTSPTAPLAPDEDPNADTHVLDRRGADHPAPPRHVRPTVPMKGVAQAISEREAARAPTPEPNGEADATVSRRPPLATPGLPAPVVPKRGVVSIGMRRAGIAGVGIFLVVGGTAAWVSLRRGPPAPSDAPEAHPAPVLTAPTVTDAGPALLAEPAPPLAHAPEPEKGTLPDAGGAAAQFEPTDALGTLVIRATPWAQVIIDGQRRGEVDGFRSFRLAPGKHRVRFEHSRGAQDLTVVIEPGHSVVREFNALKLH